MSACWRCGGTVVEVLVLGLVTLRAGASMAGRGHGRPTLLHSYCGCCGQLQNFGPTAADCVVATPDGAGSGDRTVREVRP